MSELDHYDYQLPPELIAQSPAASRDAARLLVIDRGQGTWTHNTVRDLPELLQPGDCLVFNDSRVLPARLIGQRTATGGAWEGLFLSRAGNGLWKVLSRSRGKLQPGETVTLSDRDGCWDVALRLVEKGEQGEWIARPETEEDSMGILERLGRVPLPPYIRKGREEEGDLERYQTVYAQHPGSAAAPTAGLHFTNDLLEQLKSQGVGVCFLTLHVGPGTFRPIASETLSDHQMHSEWGQVGEDAASRVRKTREQGGNVVAVGTTSVRVLESAAATAQGDGELQAWEGWTDLFIRPPYQFQAINGLMTNFHLPKSTLLVLTRTFGGDELIARAYEEAVQEKYRFYSYGDAMLIV
ncbi:MAG: tRNA preQ1(34) S-adenosylmethionine ribosyltransferase-isomerase QueA [Planctomycetales bacterium]